MTSRQPLERRMRNERRLSDAGPPVGCDERRRSPERRFPTVQFVDFDEHIEMGVAATAGRDLH